MTGWKQSAVRNVTSKSAIMEMIDRSSEPHQITGRHVSFTAEKWTGVFEISLACKSGNLPTSAQLGDMSVTEGFNIPLLGDRCMGRRLMKHFIHGFTARC